MGAMLPYIPAIIQGGTAIAGMVGGGSQEYPGLDPRIAAMLETYYPNWQQAMAGEWGLPPEMMDLVRKRGEADLSEMYFGDPSQTLGGYGGLAGKVAEYANRMGTYASPGSMGELLTRDVYGPYGKGVAGISENLALQDYASRMRGRESAMGDWFDRLYGGIMGKQGYEMGKYGSEQDFWGGLTNLGMGLLGQGGGLESLGNLFGGGGTMPLSGLSAARTQAQGNLPPYRG